MKKKPLHYTSEVRKLLRNVDTRFALGLSRGGGGSVTSLARMPVPHGCLDLQTGRGRERARSRVSAFLVRPGRAARPVATLVLLTK